MMKYLSDPVWWVTVVLCGIVISIIANFLYRIIDIFFSKNIKSIKAFNEERRSSVKKIMDYYNSDINLLIIRNFWSVSKMYYIVTAFLFSNMILNYFIVFKLRPINITTIIFIGLSLLIFFFLIIFLQKNESEMRMVFASNARLIENNTIGKFFPGKWHLTYSNPTHTGTEKVEIKDGNIYYANGSIRFTIKNFQMDVYKNKITFEKHTPEKLHSKETLNIDNSHLYTGSGTSGFSLKYERIDN